MTSHTIERLGYLGEGIADGPIYAPLTLPGEVVSGDLDGERLTNVRIETPSEDRVKPPCRHFKACGGCLLQHASDDFVAEWKLEVVRTALRAQEINTNVAHIVTSPIQSRRRATFSSRRTKKGAMAGFHARGSDSVIEIPDCILLDPEVLTGRTIAEELAVIGVSRKGELAVAVTKSAGGLDIQVQGGKPLDGQLRIDLANLVGRRDIARLAWGDEVIAEARQPYQQFGWAKVVPPAGAFLQATSEGEASLLKSVIDAVSGAKKTADLFAGCGTFSLPLAELGEVSAYEGQQDMIEALDKGWRMASGLKTVTAKTRDLFRRPLLTDELDGFDAVVIDPPRAGAKAQVAELALSSVPIIAFVSCNPVTFARDAKTLLSGGYELESVSVVDQFRWSPHIETVAKFAKPN